MHGLVYLVDPEAQLSEHRSFDLISVKVDSHIKHLSATVRILQQYHNDTGSSQSCSYVFPVPDRAAVFAFEMIKQNGTRIVGQAKEKKQAKEEYDQAVDDGKLASLLTQETPDTFQMLVGNLLADETVNIKIEYATELTEDEQNDSVRLHIPQHIGSRYGDSPLSIGASNAVSSSRTKLDLTVSIESVAAINKVTCSSHTISTDLGPDDSIAEKVESVDFARFARVSLASSSFLDKDFILSVVSKSYDAPRCMAETDVQKNTAALSVSFVPRFALPEMESQEYLFLVDRSGSMGGQRIEMAKKALIVLLRSLPSRRGTDLNIVSFGSDTEPLWKMGSRAYDQTSLDRATKLVDSMEANFGGTEMAKALQTTFETRNKSKSTSLILLTDGDAWDLPEVFACVRRAVSAAQSDAPLRIFVLGIGNSASTAMCEGIARIGNGVCQFVTDGESFTGKTTRLLKAAISQTFKSIEIDYGLQERVSGQEDEENFELVDRASPDPAMSSASTRNVVPTDGSLFDESFDPLKSAESEAPAVEPVILAPTPPLQQSPRAISSLFPGSRFNVFAILSFSSSVPESINLKATLHSGEVLDLTIPVIVSTQQHRAIHLSTAKKLIQELEDDATVGFGTTALERQNEAQIIRLGTTYHIASSKTSFVAIDETGSLKEMEKRRRQPMYNGFSSPAFGFAGAAAPRSRGLMAMFSLPAPGSAAAPAPGGQRSAHTKTTFGRATLPSAAWCPPPPAAAPTAVHSLHQASYGGAAPTIAQYGAARSVKLASTQASQSSGSYTETSHPNLMLSDADRLDLIARAQAFDGSFDSSVLRYCPSSTSLEELSNRIGVSDEQVVVAVTVLLYWSQALDALEDEWAGLAQKAREFVRARLGFQPVEVEKLLTKAGRII